MVALHLPPGFDLDRCRIGKGDSVTLSEQDPLKDRVAEGVVSDVKETSIVVQLHGNLPASTENRYWRLDKAPNRVVYERQFQALLMLAGSKHLPPCCEVMVSAKV